MTTAGIIASVVFVLTYIIIATEAVHRTKAALMGAVVMLLLRLVDQHHAFHGTHEILGIDWNTIFLLIGMMTIASTTGRTGAFQWMAIKAAKLARGHPFWIIVLLSAGTAVLSAGLDNATTVVLMAPVTILICEALEVDPIPYLIFVVLSSNVGGTATLIGDPPNIMIASAAHLSFMDFLKVDALIALVSLLALFGLAWLFVHRFVRVSLRPLAGAVLLMIWQKGGVEEIFHGVEWGTIFFIIGLFVMVAALASTGVIGLFSGYLLAITGDNILALTMGVLVVSAIVSGLIGNIAYVAAMNAVLLSLAATKYPELSGVAQIQAADMLPVWWALSIGACFGGNSTLLGTAANVAVAGISERSGYPMTFGRFLKYGIPVTAVTIVLGAIYLWILFF